MSLKIKNKYSPNFDLKKRKNKDIDFLIFHYTGMRNEESAIKKLTSYKSEVSCHYFIKKNGEILNLVPDLYTAWHAGVSNWKGLKSLNKYSIGIEINNPGHDHKYRKFSSKQTVSLIKLLRFLLKKYNIKKKNVLGHSDISPDRKKDPGEKFPWKKLAKMNLCSWHNLNEDKIKRFRNLSLSKFEEKIFLKNLYSLGYSKIIGSQYNQKKINLVNSFQRKFRQNLINGKIDQECLLISKSLIKL